MEVAAASGPAGVKLPSEQAMWEGFLAMGQRPEELQNALVQLQSRAEPPDLAFPIICSTLASAAADVEIAAIEELGTLAVTIFGRIAQGGEAGASGLFAAEAIAGYGASIGSAVDAPGAEHGRPDDFGQPDHAAVTRRLCRRRPVCAPGVAAACSPGVSAADASSADAGWINCSACHPVKPSGQEQLPDPVPSDEITPRPSSP